MQDGIAYLSAWKKKKMINYFKVEGETIAPLVDEIEKVCEGIDNSHVSIACIIVATLAQNPEVDPQVLGTLVTQISELISATAFETGSIN